MSEKNPFESFDYSIKSKLEDVNDSISHIDQKINFPDLQAQRKEEPTVAKRQQRRYRTGRNQQLNIKVTDQTIEKFYRLADKDNIPLGELFERALNALEMLKNAQNLPGYSGKEL